MRLKRALGSLGAPHGDAGGVQRLCTRVPTVERLLTSDLELLARDCGLDHSELKRLATTVAAASVPPVRTARQVLAARRAEAPLLSTGVPALDALLKGGLRAGEVCELIGAPGSGKTAACVAARVDMCRHRVPQLLRTHLSAVRLAPGRGHRGTRAVRVPGSGVPQVPRTLAP